MLTLTSISFRPTYQSPHSLAPAHDTLLCPSPEEANPFQAWSSHPAGTWARCGQSSARPRGTGSSFPRCDDSGPPPPFRRIAHSCDAPSFASGCPGRLRGTLHDAPKRLDERFPDGALTAEVVPAAR